MPLLKFIVGFVKLLLFCSVGVLSIGAILNPNPSLRGIAILAGTMGILLLTNSDVLENLKFVELMRKDFKLIEVQDLILSEVKNNNKQVVDLITSQADLLSKMTKLAVKKGVK
jgi:cytochrome c biogenesis protein CcdA